MFVERSTEAESAKLAEKNKGVSNHRLLSHLRLVDIAIGIHLGVVAILLIFFHQGVENWPFFVLGNVAFIVGLIYYIRLAERKSSKILTFFRDCYPFFIFTFVFKEIALVINILFPFWLESHLINWDLIVFGTHPTVWVQQFYRPWLTELMAFSYWSYYILFPILGFTLYFQKDKSLYFSFVFRLSFTLLTCYFLYLFLGARGPHETLASLHLDREYVFIFDKFVKSIQDAASISGAAFPSSHVASVWVVLIYMFRFKKWLGLTLLPLILALTVSVVYLQYHYAVDPIAGIIVVCITYPLAGILEKRFS
jgi:membrane-associated phospholipid phosphatase